MGVVCYTNVMSQQESKIFTTANGDYDQLFVALFSLYVQEIYNICSAAVHYNETIALQITHDIFTTAYKYIHVFTPQQGSFRFYLLRITSQEIERLDLRVPATKEHIPRKVKAKLKPAGEALWQAVHNLPRQEWIVYELWYGEHLTATDIAIILEKSTLEIQSLQTLASQRLRRVQSHFVEYIDRLFSVRTAAVQLTKSQETRLLRLVMDNRKARPNFVTQVWWAPLMRVWPVTAMAVAVGLLVGVTWVSVARPVWLFPATPTTLADVADTTTTTPTSTIAVPDVNSLPVVTSQKLSLTEITQPLFGTDTNLDHTTTGTVDTAGITPTITIKVTPERYIPLGQAYSYAVPEALDDDQLQFAALRHFPSLPLNRFTYVNGIYYLQEEPNTFQPLFVAFNADGSVEFQMRQTAICALPNLTATIEHDAAQTIGFRWLIDHVFTEVTQADLRIQQLSADNRTVPKTTFCNDGDTTAVADKQFVYYPPHIVLRYSNNPTDLLPLRLRGMAVETHGDTVTQVSVDKLDLLTQYIVRTHQVALKPLSQAITELQSFVYPNADDKADKDRFAQVFAQWNHLHGEDRFNNFTVDQVRLEYVFDELNHIVEPYYIFSGQGTTVKGDTSDMRMYVVASTESRELRGPYRQ